MSIVTENALVEGQPTITPAIAMREALHATEAAFLEVPNGSLSSSEIDRDQLLAHHSYDKCLRGSVFALAFLQNKYPGLFEKSFLVTSYRSTQGEIDSTSPLFHTCFMTKKGNKWYGASPANYIVGRNETPMTTYFEADTAEGVLRQITERDGALWPCNWPSDEFITKRLDEAYRPPELVRDRDNTVDLRVFHVERLGTGRQEGTMERCIVYYPFAA